MQRIREKSTGAFLLGHGGFVNDCSAKVNPMSKEVCIRLDVSRHCIETAIRKRYNRLVGEALRSPSMDEDTARELEMLKTCLETFDFGRLRMKYPPLAGHSSDVVELEEKKPQRPRLRINGKPVGSS